MSEDDDSVAALPLQHRKQAGSIGGTTQTTTNAGRDSPSVVHFHHSQPSVLTLNGTPGINTPRSAVNGTNTNAFSPPTPHSHLLTHSPDERSGWLLKLGGAVKKFKKRFFRLHGSRLEYYKDETSTRRLGVIPLIGATLVQFDFRIYSAHACFGITPAQSKRTFCLRGVDVPEMQRWLGWLRPQVSRQLKDKAFFTRNKHYPGSLREGIIEHLKVSSDPLAAGGKDKRWSERFCVLLKTQELVTLVLYKEVESTKPAAEIYLDTSCTVGIEYGLNESPFAFRITCARSSSAAKKFVFRVSDVEEKKDWIRVIRSAIAASPAPGMNLILPSPASQTGGSHHHALSTGGSTHHLHPSHHQARHSTDITPVSPMASPMSHALQGQHVPAMEIATIGEGDVDFHNDNSLSDNGFQYSDSDSDALSDLSIDSESDEEETSDIGSARTSGGDLATPNSGRLSTGISPPNSATGTGTATTAGGTAGTTPNHSPLLSSSTFTNMNMANLATSRGAANKLRPSQTQRESHGTAPATVFAAAVAANREKKDSAAAAAALGTVSEKTNDASSVTSPPSPAAPLDEKQTSEKPKTSVSSATTAASGASTSSSSSNTLTKPVATSTTTTTTSVPASTTPTSPSPVPSPGLPTSASTLSAIITTKNNPLMSQRIVKDGFLKKLGAKVKSWKLRYFILRGYVLSYYESKDTTDTPLGEIHLTGTLVKIELDSLFSMQFTFSVTQTQAGSRTYYMVANDKEEMDEWVFLLKQRHSFAPQGLPRKLNPRVHINMNLNPDEHALRAIAVNQQINSSYISTDADRKEHSASMIKGAVSKKKRRFVLDGFDLDLTYITNRIIAMGFPSEGTESIYRNDMIDVQRFLDTRHTNKYKVYNLCSERKYAHSKFHNRVFEFPFDDHSPCAMEDLPAICADIAEFLSGDEKNVTVIHCKAGKGRTGLIIVCFLLYCGEWQTASEALRYYAFARTQNQKGVTIASQIRWVHYWERYLSLSRDGIGLPKLEALTLKRMIFSKNRPGFDYIIANCHGETVSSRDFKIKETKLKDGSIELEFPPATSHTPNTEPPFTFLKDFQIEFYKNKLFGGAARVMSFWLHTQFVSMEPHYYLKMDRMDIDKVSKAKGIPEFTLELFFEPVTQGRKASEAVEKNAATGITNGNGASGSVQPHHGSQSSSSSSSSSFSSHGMLIEQMIHPILAQINPTLGADYNEMIHAALNMMFEGRKMTRFMKATPGSATSPNPATSASSSAAASSSASASSSSSSAATAGVTSPTTTNKEIERKDIFIFLKDEIVRDKSSSSVSQPNSPGINGGSSSAAASSSPSPVSPSTLDHNYTIYWCLDRQASSNASSNALGYERLRVNEIATIMVGKQSELWNSKNILTKQAVEDRCFSIITRSGNEIHLEAYSERQLSLWLEGLKFILSNMKDAPGYQEEEGEAFSSAAGANGASPVQPIRTSSATSNALQPSNVPHSASPATSPALNSSSVLPITTPISLDTPWSPTPSSPSATPRERAESYARPPPIKVPASTHRRQITIGASKEGIAPGGVNQPTMGVTKGVRIQ